MLLFTHAKESQGTTSLNSLLIADSGLCYAVVNATLDITHQGSVYKLTPAPSLLFGTRQR